MNFPQACNFIKKETLTQVFSYEFYKISRTLFLQNMSGRLFLFMETNSLRLDTLDAFRSYLRRLRYFFRNFLIVKTLVVIIFD